jgi:hypothetical protein
MKPKSVGPTAEQKQQEERAKSDNLKAIQEGLGNQTAMFRRLQSPRVSIATGRR